MRRAEVKFRDELQEVEYRDHGYEPDTNAHVIDWHFTDPEVNQLERTDAEDEDIYNQLLQKTYDYDEDDR